MGVGIVHRHRVKVIGAVRWSCFITSAMFAGLRLHSRPGFAGVENVQLYARSETLQMCSFDVVSSKIWRKSQSDNRTWQWKRQASHDSAQRLVRKAPPRHASLQCCSGPVCMRPTGKGFGVQGLLATKSDGACRAFFSTAC